LIPQDLEAELTRIIYVDYITKVVGIGNHFAVVCFKI